MSDFDRLRKFLNPAIRGPNTNAILESIATGTEHLIHNVEAVNDNLYIISAIDRYLDARLGDMNITRPENLGLFDDVFREIGIEVANRKQVRDLILRILEIMYGEDYTRASCSSTEFETYNLEDGDSLIVQFDDQERIEVFFSSGQFQNMTVSTAQEVADAITKEIRRQGRRGIAIAKDDGLGPYVMLMSETNGPASSVRVLGGKAQNVLRFPTIRPTSAQITTEWTLEQTAGGSMRVTWTGGADPSLGKVRKNDYVNIYGSAFDDLNMGTFTITKVVGGTVGNAYFEFENPNGVSEVVLQGTLDGMLFFASTRFVLTSKLSYATLYQTESRLLEIFLPATTRVVRRDRIGAAHLHESGPSTVDDLGPYIFDVSKGYTIGSEECNTTSQVDSSTGVIVNVDDSSQIPDDQGFLIFGFGTKREEGPVPYISRPSSTSLMINPSYKFKFTHPSGTNISIVNENHPYIVEKDGSDYPFYLTDVVSGRIYTEDLIKLVYATGINLAITILYPNDIGMGKWGTENSEKTYVWGEDPE